jgi:nucleoid-associated protein YgaU
MVQSKLEKAQISVLEGKMKGDTITCAFNPTEYTLKKGAAYAREEVSGLDTPVAQFAGGEADTLSMDLFFDTSEAQNDVRPRYTDKVDALLQLDGELHAPPPCRFVWGGGIHFEAVLTSSTTQFTRFLPSGVPVRARVSVEFEGYEPPSAQRARTKFESTDKTKAWTVTEGDTLWSIASEEYGDPERWRIIATANGIVNARALEPGRELTLPPL